MSSRLVTVPKGEGFERKREKKEKKRKLTGEERLGFGLR
jgi:hypothetical protein